MEQGSKEKERLIEAIGVHFEKNLHLPPLASRIYALFILGSKTGHSFDEIIVLSQSSKSSVSTNINLLLQSGIVEYFTKAGDRKRYFRLKKNYLQINLAKTKQKIREELNLLEKIRDYNLEYNEEKYENYKKIGQLYRGYLSAQFEILESTLTEMNQLEY